LTCPYVQHEPLAEALSAHLWHEPLPSSAPLPSSDTASTVAKTVATIVETAADDPHLGGSRRLTRSTRYTEASPSAASLARAYSSVAPPTATSAQQLAAAVCSPEADDDIAETVLQDGIVTNLCEHPR
jgi:hypothetical protein